MSNNRGLIRDAVRATLQPLFSFPVYADRKVDGREETEFINAYLVDGDVEREGLRDRTTAVLAIAYRTEADATDDEIDVISDQIETAMTPQVLGDLASGLLYDGFEYLDERERGFSGITLRFSVVY